MALFNFFNQFGKKSEKLEKDSSKREESFAPPSFEDAIVINSGGVISQAINFGDFGYANEKELIETWRELASRPEIDWAIQEIVNEAIVTDYVNFPVSLEIGKSSNIPKKISDRLHEEFSKILGLMNFNRTASEKFRQWYIDGKHYYHGIVDPKNPSGGLIGIRWIDPRTIKKIVEIEKTKNEQGVEIDVVKDVYYYYNSYISGKIGGFNFLTRVKQPIKVHSDAIAYANSGLFREKPDGTIMAISHLDKAVKPANQLRLLEDSLVIYRLARAPERRIFYIDTGNLPKVKAEQYVLGLMNRFKNKMVYDVNTGEVKDQRNILSILEDYWLPRREGGRGTEVTTLAGGQNLGELDDVEYFYKKLYRSLNIPLTRLQSETAFNLGRSAEITREEVKFAMFIDYLRSKFSETFVQLLKIQVITKNIMREEDFEELAPFLFFRWKTNSYWDELMNNEMWQARFSLLQQAEPYINDYFSKEWVEKNILHLTDEEIEILKKQRENQPKDEIDKDYEEEKNEFLD